MFCLMQKNEPPTLIWLEETFNKYGNPGENNIWDHVCSRIHGLTADSHKFKEADGMGIVWHQFCNWINDLFAKDDVGILVAYNGEICDLKWLWKITQAPHSTLSFPSCLKFFGCSTVLFMSCMLFVSDWQNLNVVLGCIRSI